MSFRKEAFWQIGLFIESLGPGSAIGTGEDTEFTYRLLSHGCKVVYSPTAVVQHDNWLDRDQFAEMMKVAVRAKAAVFCSYALRRDPLAFSHLLRTAWHLAHDRLAVGSSLAGLAYFATGLSKGVRYRFERPPRLEFSTIWKVRSLMSERACKPACRCDVAVAIEEHGQRFAAVKHD
jgi:GT2 family glycosyltransferase